MRVGPHRQVERTGHTGPGQESTCECQWLEDEGYNYSLLYHRSFGNLAMICHVTWKLIHDNL